MNKNHIFVSGFISLLVFLFFLISNFPFWFSLALAIVVFIVFILGLEILSSKNKEKMKYAKQTQAKVLENAFMRGQKGAFKGYGFNKQNKSWVLKNKK
ncbi:MAG: hypothetical protein AABW58_03650 [Nanoarchaeota archaeon]